MKQRKFGNTDLFVSEVGFGAWAIGGPVMAGNIPIGWGQVDDDVSRKAIYTALDRGINFFDTADFYGLGHSEELLGITLAKNNDVIIATKVGHELLPDGSINLNYSKKYIISACEKSLQRLKRDYIDFYQLHSARLLHLGQGECIDAMQSLQQQGKIRYWGISLNTFYPEPEAEFFVKNKLGHGFQLVLNIINQRAAKSVLNEAEANGYGVIARMPLQFGLLTGKFSENTMFNANDHRSFRLPPDILIKSIYKLQPVFDRASKLNLTPTSYAINFILSFSSVSTAITGVKTVSQVIENTSNIGSLQQDEIAFLRSYYEEELATIVDEFEKNK